MKFKSLKYTTLFFIWSCLLIGCSVDDGRSEVSFNYELNKIVEVEIPETMRYESEYDLHIDYEKSTTCQEFSGFNFELGDNENERIISVVSHTIDRNNTCEKFKSPRIENRDFTFSVKRDDFYILKFYQVMDSLNQPIYLTKKVEIK